jgi:hypothetical protein
MKSQLGCIGVAIGLLLAAPAYAAPFSFDTGSPDGLLAAASRPSGPSFEIEAADDFPLIAQTMIDSATFTGLITNGGTIQSVTVEIYRVFPQDSNVGRTSGPPTFATPQVPTRVNSPSDVALTQRSSGALSLTFTTTTLNGNFTAANSIAPGGIHPLPNVMTGGNGPASGQEFSLAVDFTTPLNLPAGHYFIVPQVQVANGDFLWLSAPRPITSGTPFPAGITDLQAWTRDQALDPDWLRIGTDIVGSSTFNMSFSLSGDTVAQTPLPGTLSLFASGLGIFGFLARRRMRGTAE